ncbi:HAUS augmin-like complex subunit 8 [Carlito syrichta]|uniref:HAUS augmin-like complex subunit 8 n=1 Tax=Carlito syrichta TaxID=1868482 RepID=A0A1U7TX51_CARSF|nr:HAUS augmin-like complex subunit 8 [Carlito syrichta]
MSLFLLRKPSTVGLSTSGGTRIQGRRAQGARVVESRYLQYEKKVTKKAPTADVSRTRGKASEGGRKPSLLQQSKADSSGVGKGNLQSTLLEGHSLDPPDLDLSTINDKSMVRKMSQLEKTMSKKTKQASSSAPQKSPDPSRAMEEMESQMLLLILLTVKMENSLAQFEEEAERRLLAVCREREALERRAHALRCQLLLSQRTRELAHILVTQIEMLSPSEAVAAHFKEQYKTFATALDTTRHELPMRAIHLEGDGQQLLDALQTELMTTYCLLGELGIDNPKESVQVLDLLNELQDVTTRKDQELHRSFAQVLELSDTVSKEAALANQEAWEEAQGMAASSWWYFGQDSASRKSPGTEKHTI